MTNENLFCIFLFMENTWLTLFDTMQDGKNLRQQMIRTSNNKLCEMI